MSDKKEAPALPVKQLVIDQLSERLRRLERNFESVVVLLDEETHRTSGVSASNCFLLVYLAFLAGIVVAREIYSRDEERKKR
jgi:hypothetical protein